VFVGEHAVRAGAAKGTVKGGNAISPWAANQPVDGDLIKQQAKDGRLGQQLYAVVVKTSAGFGYRPPNAAELDALEVADAELARILPGWDAKDIIPNERITSVSNYDRGHRLYGMEHWREFFAPRQLLAHGTIVECLNVVAHQVRKELEPDRAKAVATYLRLGADKALDYDSRLTRWDSTRLKIVNGFDKHGYKFLWSHPEFEAARNLIPWCMDQVADAYIGMAKLANPDGGYQVASKAPKLAPLHQIFGSAASIESVPSGSVNLVCTDPPYHDNVMYAECSDFFYVWLRRNLSGLYPSFFESDETNKDEEAVANVARFASVGKRKKELATSDYERKMASAFREIYRVLQPTGTLSVMFTHKKVEAWDTLATSLIGAGFSIKSSWPVHTESEHSTHQAKKNAAQSTIMLTCRKRDTGGDPVWWDDLKGKVRKVARDTAIQLEKQGIRGVDLYIATFGPTLAILSDSWPVLTSEVDDKGNPKPLRPEVALDLARAEVVALRKQDLLLGRTVQFDKATDWYLMAWDAFAAAEFPADEARKLALALDLDLERDVIAQKRLVTKKQSTVVLQEPGARRKRDMVDPDKTSFDCWIDAVHTAMLLYSEDGANACQRFLRVSGLMTDSTFKALVQALLNVIPRTRIKGKFVRPEAEVLEAMRLSFFDDLTVPVEEEVKLPDRQGSLFSGAEVAEDAPGVDEDGEDAEDEEDEE
jgi:adenine-specific DNA methylase